MYIYVCVSVGWRANGARTDRQTFYSLCVFCNYYSFYVIFLMFYSSLGSVCVCVCLVEVFRKHKKTNKKKKKQNPFTLV